MSSICQTSRSWSGKREAGRESGERSIDNRKEGRSSDGKQGKGGMERRVPGHADGSRGLNVNAAEYQPRDNNKDNVQIVSVKMVKNSEDPNLKTLDGNASVNLTKTFSNLSVGCANRVQAKSTNVRRVLPFNISQLFYLHIAVS